MCRIKEKWKTWRTLGTFRTNRTWNILSKFENMGGLENMKVMEDMEGIADTDEFENMEDTKDQKSLGKHLVSGAKWRHKRNGRLSGHWEYISLGRPQINREHGGELEGHRWHERNGGHGGQGLLFVFVTLLVFMIDPHSCPCPVFTYTFEKVNNTRFMRWNIRWGMKRMWNIEVAIIVQVRLCCVGYSGGLDVRQRW